MSDRAFLPTASSVVFACFLLIVAGSFACGRSGLDDYLLVPGDSGTETGVDSGTDAGQDAVGPDVTSCNAATCSGGCCDANGQCKPGSDMNICGILGERCEDCAALGFAFCDPLHHACGVDVGMCDATNCKGCCQGSFCLEGTDDSTCGVGGQGCQDCTGFALVCAANQCAKPTCGPGNCQGCCFGNQCLSGADATACGQNGSLCTNCMAAGNSCASVVGVPGGVCSISACNCPSGCCDGQGLCQNGVSDSACGFGGIQCENCGIEMFQCVGQTCVPPPLSCSQSCKGCCDAGGNCTTGFFDNQCGNSGALCVDCTKLNAACVNYQCLSDGGTVCSAQTCPMGCCDAMGVCQSGTTDTQCRTVFGGACQDCAKLGEQCQKGQCVLPPPPTMCSQTCPGCCDAAGNCEPGFLDAVCGETGATCQDCTAIKSTCDVSVSPRSCTSQQMQCPAPYPSCAPDLQQDVPVPQKACSTSDLQNASAACSGGADTAACDSFFQFESLTNPACADCLAPFDFTFRDALGLLACASPQLDATCNHNGACLLDCVEQSCNGCLDALSTTQCQNQVRAGQCATFFQNDQCLLQALRGPASVCNPALYQGNFGSWLKAVGAQYCAQ